MAMGMVMPMVNTPHGLLNRAFVTATPSPARATMMMNRVTNAVVTPVSLLTSRRAMTDSDCPWWRTDAKRMIMSWTHPAKTEPRRIQKKPGPHPYWAAASDRSRPAPAIAAKWWPKTTHLLVGT